MKFLEFDQKYETELIELWNYCMIHDQISIEKFRKQVLYDENFDKSLCLLAIEDHHLWQFHTRYRWLPLPAHHIHDSLPVRILLQIPEY